jgi:methylmalonyl-CoA/ethylmalonyl-CoA epimerase
MLERLWQVALLVRDLQDAGQLYHRVLGMEPCCSSDLAEYGLTNLVLPASKGTFIELLQPTSPDSAASRYLQRRGEAPYLLIFETHRYDQLIPHLKSIGVRITAETERPGVRSAFVHPSATNGVFLEIIEVNDPENPWPPAGPDWYKKEWSPKTCQFRQIAVLESDLDRAIHRWSEMFGLQATRRFQISFTDLEIAVLPLQGRDTLIELAQPTSPDTPSARFLERYGEGIYLIIFQIDNSLEMDAYLQGQGIRYTTSRVTANYVNLGFNSIWLHPSSMRGAFIQLSQVLDSDNPWPPAGEDWYV